LLLTSPFAMRAATRTPAGPRGACATLFPRGGGLPQDSHGSAPALMVSRRARCSLTLRPARLADPQKGPFLGVLQSIRRLLDRPECSRLERQFADRGLSPRRATCAFQGTQSPFIERLIGSIRRECLDHILVISEAHLRRVLREYFAYYHDSRPHQSLDGNAPRPREIEPPSRGRIVADPQVGGLHHRYRRAA
jgi:hypothetical protein